MLLDSYPTAHLPGPVLADLAVVIADGGDALCHLATLRDQDKLFGVVASDATAWRCLDRVDDAHLAALQAVRAAARERAWAAGGGPDLAAGRVVDLDATITIAHSEKENAARTWKKTYGFSSAARVPGPPGRCPRGGVGRAAAGRERRLEHHR